MSAAAETEERREFCLFKQKKWIFRREGPARSIYGHVAEPVSPFFSRPKHGMAR